MKVKWIPKGTGIFISLDETEINEYSKNPQGEWHFTKSISLPNNLSIGINLLAPFTGQSLSQIYLSHYHKQYTRSQNSSDSSVISMPSVINVIRMKTDFDFIMADSKITIEDNDKITEFAIAKFSMLNQVDDETIIKNVSADLKINNHAFTINAQTTHNTDDNIMHITAATKKFDASLLNQILHNIQLSGSLSLNAKSQINFQSNAIDRLTAQLSSDHISLQQDTMIEPLRLDNINAELHCTNDFKSTILHSFTSKFQEDIITGHGNITGRMLDLNFISQEGIKESRIYDKITAFTSHSVNLWLRENLTSTAKSVNIKRDNNGKIAVTVGLADSTIKHAPLNLTMPLAQLQISHDNVNISTDTIEETEHKITLKQVTATIPLDKTSPCLNIKGQAYTEITGEKLKTLNTQQYSQLLDKIAAGYVYGNITLNIPLSHSGPTQFNIMGTIDNALIKDINLYDTQHNIHFPELKYHITEKALSLYGNAAISGIPINYFKYIHDFANAEADLLIDTPVSISKLKQLKFHNLSQHIIDGSSHLHLNIIKNKSQISYDITLDGTDNTFNIPSLYISKDVNTPITLKAKGHIIPSKSIKVDHYKLKSEDLHVHGSADLDLKQNDFNLTSHIDHKVYNNLSATFSNNKRNLEVTLDANYIDVSNYVSILRENIKNYHNISNTMHSKDDAEEAQPVTKMKLPKFLQFDNASLKFAIKKLITNDEHHMTNFDGDINFEKDAVTKIQLSTILQDSLGYANLFYDREVTSFVTNNLSALIAPMQDKAISQGGDLEMKFKCNNNECNGAIAVKSMKFSKFPAAINAIKILSLTSIYSALQGSGLMINNAMCDFSYSKHDNKILKLHHCQIKSPIFYCQGDGSINISQKTAKIEAMISPMDLFRSISLFIGRFFPSVMDRMLRMSKTRTNFILEKQANSDLHLQSIPLSILLPGGAFSRKRNTPKAQ